MRKHTEPVVYLEVEPIPGVTAEDVLDHCRTVQAVSRRAHHNARRVVVDRIEYAPHRRPLVLHIVFAEDATPMDAATLRVTLEPFAEGVPTIRRRNLGTPSMTSA